MCSIPAGRPARRSTRSSISAGPRPSSWWCSLIAAIASCRSRPITSARTCRRRSSESVHVRLLEVDGADEVVIDERGLSMEAIQPATPPLTALRRKDLLSIADLSAEEIVLILDTAEAMKEVGQRAIKKVPTLRGRTVVNLFFEPSTRTRTSFEIAEKRLERRHAQRRHRDLERGQGRDARRHGDEHRGHGAEHDRAAPQLLRRVSHAVAHLPCRASSMRVTGCTSIRRRRCSMLTRSASARAHRPGSRWPSSATSSTAACCDRTSCCCASWALKSGSAVRRR